MRQVYVKIGGSFITYKDKPITLNYNAFYCLRDILHRSIENSEVRIVAGNGGGSFAHYTVSKYATSDNRLLLIKCQESTRILNKVVVDFLVENNIPATSVQTSSIVYYDENTGNFEVFYKTVEVLLENKIIPIMYGECIPTRNKPLVISTEKVFQLLARYLKPDRIVLLTDVNGIYTCDPKKCKEAILIKRITPSSVDEILDRLKQYEKADVTGSVYGKVLSMSKLAVELGVEIVVVSGFDVNSAVTAIRGGYPENATLITPN